MKISDTFPSNYIKASDLKGRPVRVRMNYVKVEKIGEDSKPVLYFIGKEKGMVLNKTNANVISLMYGDDTDGWSSGEVELFPTETDFAGKRVDAIRVRMPSRQIDQDDRIAPNARARQEPVAANTRPDYRQGPPSPPPRDDFEDEEIPF